MPSAVVVVLSLSSWATKPVSMFGPWWSSLPPAGVLSHLLLLGRLDDDGGRSCCHHRQRDPPGEPRRPERVSALGEGLGCLLHRGEMKVSDVSQ